MSEIRETVRANIMAARKRTKMTQGELALELGVSSRMIGKYESGQADASYEKLEQMAKIMALPGGWLWFFQEHKEDTVSKRRWNQASEQFSSDEIARIRKLLSDGTNGPLTSVWEVDFLQSLTA